MTLQLQECRWAGDYVDMAFRTRTVATERELRFALSMPFGELPDGEWFELFPLTDTVRGQTPSGAGDVIFHR
jgi:hypothetical protein